MTISGSHYIPASAAELKYPCSQINLVSSKVEHTFKSIWIINTLCHKVLSLFIL